MWTVDEGIRRLRERGAKITTQRVAILERLCGRRDHPSADALFGEVRARFPGLSIATIYGTAQTLRECGLIRILSIDDKRVYFDPSVSPHGHFFCRECGALFDIPWEGNDVERMIRELPGAEAESAELFVYGRCAECARRGGLSDPLPLSHPGLAPQEGSCPPADRALCLEAC